MHHAEANQFRPAPASPTVASRPAVLKSSQSFAMFAAPRAQWVSARHARPLPPPDSLLAQVPDQCVTACSTCTAPFTLLRRRHRACLPRFGVKTVRCGRHLTTQHAHRLPAVWPHLLQQLLPGAPAGDGRKGREAVLQLPARPSTPAHRPRAV